VIVRAPFGPKSGYAVGYEAQINYHHRDPNKTGSIYAGGRSAEVPVVESPVPGHDWFTLEIITQANHVAVKVNGRTTAYFTDPETRFASGHIALQQHNPQTIVEFRTIEIKELGVEHKASKPGAGRSSYRYPTDAIAFLGKHYRVFPQQLSWHAAKSRCEQMGGHLAIVTKDDENRFLTDLVRSQGLDSAWLGATDERTGGRWAWVDGTPMRYSKWTPLGHQPNNKQVLGHYLLLWVADDGKWSDQPNSSSVHRPGFVCQWD
jgi:hypothetical protein